MTVQKVKNANSIEKIEMSKTPKIKKAECERTESKQEMKLHNLFNPKTNILSRPF